MNRRPSATELWQIHFDELSRWLETPLEDRSTLKAVIATLEELLRYYPNESAAVQKLSLSSTYMAKAYRDKEAVCEFAETGMAAALLRGPKTDKERVSASLLALLSSGAHLGVGEMLRGQELLDEAEKLNMELDTTGVLYPYLQLHIHNLRGIFAEAALEFDSAAESFALGSKVGMSLVDDPSVLQEVTREATHIIWGNLDEVFENGNDAAIANLKDDLISSVRLATLGYSRTASEDKLAAGHAAVEICRRFGLPEDHMPVDLRPALLSLPRGELEKAVEHLEPLTARCSDQASWQTMLRTTCAASYGLDSELELVNRSFQQALNSMKDCYDSVTLAVTMGDFMMFHSEPIGHVKNKRFLKNFEVPYNHVIKHASTTPEFLRLRTMFDKPIAAAVEYAFELCRIETSPQHRRMISVLLDAFRSPHQDLATDETLHSSIGRGLDLALDRLQRLHMALLHYPDAVAVILQTAGNDMLFICVTGDKREPFLFERAGPDYSVLASELAAEQRRQIFRKGKRDDLVLQRKGRKVFDAVPRPIREIINEKQIILFVPDFRSDQDSVPFELWHDGNNFLGLSKIISRSVSLRELVRAIELPVLPIKSTTRAIGVAVPSVEGFSPLIYATDEMMEVNDILKEDGWEFVTSEQYEIDPNLLLHGAELADILHIAAHGEIYAGHEAIVLQDGQRVTVADIESRPRNLKSMVFLNTCSLGKSRYLGAGVSRGIAYALKRAGAPCVIANQLPVEDLSAMLLSIAFYDEAKSESVGESLRIARNRIASEIPVAFWGATVLVGNPFHQLPFTENDSGRAEDVTTRLLNAYTSETSTDSDRYNAVAEAELQYRERPEDVRLGAALIWTREACKIEPDSVDTGHLEEIIRLGDELDHPAGKALFLYHRATDENYTKLDEAITALDSIKAYSKVWKEAYMECLKRRQLLKIREEPRPILDGPIRVNDPEDPAVQLFLGTQYALDEAEDRLLGAVKTMQPEKTIESFVWNAVLLGKENRFPDSYACSVAVEQLAGKLSRFVTSEAVRIYASRIIGGFLPYLWSSQRVTHLDHENARSQSAALGHALREAIDDAEKRDDIIKRGVSVTSSIEETVNGKHPDISDKYSRALSALDGSGWGSTSSLKATVEEMMSRLADSNVAAGTAWVLGELLHYYGMLKYSGQPAVAGTILAIYENVIMEADPAFSRFLQVGYKQKERDPYGVFIMWESSLSI